MITAEEIKRVNENVKKIELKGKKYVCVFARVAAFREICPNGTITTEILSMKDGIVTMKATVQDETGKVLSTGMAQEKETSSYVNKTSYIENCETSAVGRALGMLGIGTDESMATAEEMVNALSQQNDLRKQISDNELKVLESLAEQAGLDVHTIKGYPNISREEYAVCMQQARKALDGNEGKNN